MFGPRLARNVTVLLSSGYAAVGVAGTGGLAGRAGPLPGVSLPLKSSNSALTVPQIVVAAGAGVWWGPAGWTPALPRLQDPPPHHPASLPPPPPPPPPTTHKKQAFFDYVSK